MRLFVAYCIGLLFLISCEVRLDPNSDLPAGWPSDSLFALDLTIDSNIEGIKNSEINHLTLISIKENYVVSVRSLQAVSDIGVVNYLLFKDADSLIVISNLSAQDQAKIAVGINAHQLGKLTFGRLNDSGGVELPFICKAVLTKAELAAIKGNVLKISLTPLVCAIRFDNAAQVDYDKIIISNIASHAIYLPIAQLGSAKMEVERPADEQFECYIYPSRQFVIQIVRRGVVLTKTIEALQANSLITIEIEAPPVDPPVVPDPPVDPPVTPPVTPPVVPDPPVTPPVVPDPPVTPPVVPDPPVTPPVVPEPPVTPPVVPEPPVTPPVVPEPPVTPPVVPDPPIEPPLVEPTHYKFYIDNRQVTVPKGGKLTLPITEGELYAYLNPKLELKLAKTESWIRLHSQASPSLAPSTNVDAGREIRLVASFANRTIEQQQPSAIFRFDANQTLNNDRTAIFNVEEIATQKMLTAITATQNSPAPPTEIEKNLVQLTKLAQWHVISLPNDVEATSYTYSSQPAGHTIQLEYKTSDIMPDNKTMLQADLTENKSGQSIIYTIKILGQNRTTKAFGNYTYRIEHLPTDTPRKDGDVRNFLKSERSLDDSYGVIFMIDGMINEDLQPGGAYDRYADKILSYIFSKEPFATYKDYMNVYVVYVESQKRGLEGKLDTYFMNNRAPRADLKAVKKYADKIPGYNLARLIGINHFDAGNTNGMVYANLDALFTIDNEATALHEFGHTFNLADEYDSGGFTTSTPSTKSAPNLDITSDLKRIKWKHFIGLPGYEDVGAFEGGAYRPDGIWRPERYSVMRNYRKDFPHFNAPSREGIVKRILYYANISYNFEEFLRLDKPTKQPPYKP